MNRPRAFLFCLLMTTLTLPSAAPAAPAAADPPPPLPAAPQLDPGAAPAPVAARRPKIVGLHGDKLADPYFWLRDKDDPAVLDYLKAENAYAAAVMAPFDPLVETLYREMLARVKQTDATVPYRLHGYWLYHRTEEGKQYAIHCRRRGSPDAPEEVTLDVNRLAEGQKFMALGAFDYSDDNAWLAYSTDVTGHRDYDFHLKDLTTGREVPTPVGKVADLVWAADNRTLFYVTEDEAKRSNRLWRYTLGEPAPALLYEEKDELFDLAVARSRDGRYLFAGSVSKRTTEFRFLAADQPKGELRLIAPRRDEVQYWPEHRAGTFYLRTNDGAKEYRVVTAPVTDPGPANWREFVPTRPGMTIDDFEPFAHQAVLVERQDGLPQFRVLDYERPAEGRTIVLPEPAYLAAAAENPEFDAPAFRFHYESPVTPPSVFDYSFATHAQTLLKRDEVPGGYDPTRYAVERVAVTAADGTRVPLDVIHRKDLVRDGRAPGWLYGYGSYGISIDASFSANRISLLDRGVVYALAHIRGGGEMGEAWHDGGRMLTKKNTFTDFVACADFLAAEKYTAHDRLVIQGGSAGGLLIGATLNLRPDVARAAILQVPFVDVLNTMSDPTLPLTTGEYIEWGNPNQPDEYAYIKSYSPYDNLAAKAYPAMLLVTSLNDSQVPYWEPAKFAAKLRALKTDHNPLLLKINLDAGHGGASGRFDRLREVAFEYAFGLAALGQTK